jgi:hypothetical protein
MGGGKMMEELKACSAEDALKWVEKELSAYSTDNAYLVGPEIEAVEALLCIRNELNRRVGPEKVKELYYEYQKLQRWQKHSANEWCKGYGSGIRRALIALGLNKEAKT